MKHHVSSFARFRKAVLVLVLLLVLVLEIPARAVPGQLVRPRGAPSLPLRAPELNK